MITNGASASMKDFDECCSDGTKVIANLIQLSIRVCVSVAPREAGDRVVVIWKSAVQAVSLIGALLLLWPVGYIF